MNTPLENRVAITTAPSHHPALQEVITKIEAEFQKLGYEIHAAEVHLLHPEHGRAVLQVAPPIKAPAAPALAQLAEAADEPAPVPAPEPEAPVPVEEPAPVYAPAPAV